MNSSDARRRKVKEPEGTQNTNGKIKKKKKGRTKFVLLTILLILCVSAAMFFGIFMFYVHNVIGDDLKIDASAISQKLTSTIMYQDEEGQWQELQKLYGTENRKLVDLADLPDYVGKAVVSIEDERFYKHHGVDWLRTGKATMMVILKGDSSFGGSTLTQQLVKNVSQEKSITVQRKVMEIFRAQIFERQYDKNLIMEEYLNRIYLGKGCYGVKSAAAAYFGKELSALTPAECASLISITNNPSLFNPFSQNEFRYKGAVRDGAGRNRYRQLNVLREMHSQGYLTDAEYLEAVEQKMVFKDGIDTMDRIATCENPDCNYTGKVATLEQKKEDFYCPECGDQVPVTWDASQHIYSWFVDSVIIDVASDLAEMDGVEWDRANEVTRNYYLERIQKGGYHIYTTLDMDVQNQVDAIYQDLSNIPKTRSTQQLQSAIVVIDNSTGDIVALSGGVGEKTDFLAYNKATQAKLQTGSSQKPISVYAPAFEKGVASPITVFKDLPLNYDEGPYPKNDSREYAYARTVYSGIVSSVNTISVRTLKAIGEEYGYSFAKYNFGQKSLTEHYPLANGKSLSDIALSPLAMGALTVGSTVKEMSAAYATFANKGTYREPRTYTKVYNSDGKLIIDNTQDSRKILSEKTVDYMNYCLYAAANYGTGGAAIFPGQSIAGKTGTTSSNRDRWFCGYTKYYTAAVWCGYNQPEQIYLLGGYNNPAARLWRLVMEPIHKGLKSKALYNGNNFQSVAVCLDSGMLATAACGSDARGINRVSAANVYQEDVPDYACTKHIMVDYCVKGHAVANKYCKLMPDNVVESRGLVKMTMAEVNEIKAALRVGLSGSYDNDGGIYLVDENGEPQPWYGFHGDAYNAGGMPYAVCTKHTKEKWEKYQQSQDID